MSTKTQLISQGIGRRKKATATVSLFLGTGNLSINDENAEKYFQYNLTYLSSIEAPLKKLELDKEYDIIVKVLGGGLTGQAEAVRLGIARALCKIKIENRSPLKREGFLSCDSRVKERKKYGLKKARKASQFSKR
uniref:ribosomal protein S9 n=1 Tax=Chattonella marina TaxID=90936 RepID=UPI0021153BD3|nr:ribosomal protein S9 [Chattonella marina]UTE94768.1 ribosomal protein S9 [Chattonella marina]